MVGIVAQNRERLEGVLSAVQGLVRTRFGSTQLSSSERKAWGKVFKRELVDASLALYVELVLPLFALALLTSLTWGVLQNTSLGQGFWPLFVAFIVALAGQSIHAQWTQLCAMVRPGQDYDPLSLMERGDFAPSLYKRFEFVLYSATIIALPCWVSWLILACFCRTSQ
jgi:hypothetical protein